MAAALAVLNTLWPGSGLYTTTLIKYCSRMLLYLLSQKGTMLSPNQNSHGEMD